MLLHFEWIDLAQNHAECGKFGISDVEHLGLTFSYDAMQAYISIPDSFQLPCRNFPYVGLSYVRIISRSSIQI